MLQRNTKMLESEQSLQKIPKKIEETIRLLSLRSEAKVLERLKEHHRRFSSIANYCNSLQDLDNKVFFDLFLRTSLEKSSTYEWHNAIPIKHFENLVMYRCIGGKYMVVWGAIHGDGRHSWEKIELEFTLPDENLVLRVESPFDLHILSPVTYLLQKGIYHLSLTGQGYSPTISNFHTAVYFLNALDFSVASHIAFHSWDKPAPRYTLSDAFFEPEEDYQQSTDDHEWSNDEYEWATDESI